MTSLFSFFVILLVAIIFSQLFSRMKIPWVVALIVGGILIGPSGFDIFETDPTIEFFAYMGLIFLMFMAGLESKVSGIKGIKKRIATIGFFIGIVPAIGGFGLTLLFGYPWQMAILIGIIFMSSAVALLIPQFQEQKIINSDLGKTIVATMVAVDALSLFLLSIFIQVAKDTFSYSSLFIYLILIIGLIIFAKLLPRIHWLTFEDEYAEKQDLYEKELRFLILVLVGSVILFEIVGLHAIIAAFFAGLMLNGSMKSRLLKAKLHAVGYGFLIPIFFVTVGAKVDLNFLTEGFQTIFLVMIIVLSLIVFKFFGGWISGRLTGFTNQESAFLGVSSLPQLSTSLAVAFLGFSEGFLDQTLLAAIIMLSVITATLSPILLSILGKNLHSQKVVLEEREPEKL